MDSTAGRSAKRRRGSSPSDECDLARRPYEGVRREHGDTYISGSANVQFGDRIYLANGDTSLNQESQRFQDSLAFPHMHERYESLGEASDGTYQWILESEADEELVSRQEQMTPFFNWFRDGTGIFWISGKPGSGKSTLMKYLVENTSPVLAEPTSITSAGFSFFFWIGGSDLQRNRIGCMRSLLWQAFQNQSTKSSVLHVCQSHFKGTWTERLLRTVLSAFLQSLGSPIAIFLDGLDESNDHDDVLDFLDVFRSAPKVKLCVSSRPETTLVESLKSYPSLKLQNLNLRDIQHVIKTTFLNDTRVQALTTKLGSDIQREALRNLGQEIEIKADGVFLWVILVIKDLLRGITQRDDLVILSNRVERLPNDIHTLYQDLLRRAQPESKLYKEEAALYLSLVLHREFDLIGFCFAINEELRQEYLCSSVFDRSVRPSLTVDCETVTAWVCTRTAGLLEVSSYPEWEVTSQTPPISDRSLYIADVLRNYGGFYVHFMHRTVRDFLQITTQGHSLLSGSSFSRPVIEKICFEAGLIYLTVLPALLGHYFGPDDIERILDCTNCIQEVIYDYLKDQGQSVMESLFSAGLLLPDTSNWLNPYNNKRRISFFPSSKHARVDILPALIRPHRYDMARMWLGRYNYHGDRVYLTMLLIVLLNCAHMHGEDISGFLELLQTLLESGADIRSDIDTPIGEVFNPLGWALTALSTVSDERKAMLYRLLGLEQVDLATRTWPSCIHCHAVWHRSEAEDDLFNLRFELWGSFRVARFEGFESTFDSFPKDMSHDILNYGNENVLVFVSYPHLRDTQTKFPQLWAVSGVTSHSLKSYITRNFPLAMMAPGICGILSSSSGQPEDARKNIEDFCAELPTLTFAAALSHLEKCPETIQKFYESEAKGMVHEPAEEQARWRQWYWGHELPAIVEENDM